MAFKAYGLDSLTVLANGSSNDGGGADGSKCTSKSYVFGQWIKTISSSEEKGSQV